VTDIKDLKGDFLAKMLAEDLKKPFYPREFVINVAKLSFDAGYKSAIMDVGMV